MNPRAFVFFVMVPILASAQDRPRQPPALALTHVSVIDVTSSASRPDMTVVVEGTRVVAVTPAARARIPRGARVVDGRGRFLIPGLWDMHVHLGVTGVDYRPFFPLFIVNGVTGVRDMGGVLHQGQFDVWREEIRRGRLLGPHLVVAGTIVDGARPVRPLISIAAGSAESGRLAVDSLVRSRADFVKVYSLLAREAYFAIARQAARREIPFAGHVPHAVTAIEASDARQASFEHLIGIPLSVSRDEQRLRIKLRGALSAPGFDPASEWETTLGIEDEALDSIDPLKEATLYAHLAANGTWQCPTLTVFQGAVGGSDPRDPRLRYLPATLKARWADEAAAATIGRTRTDAAAVWSKSQQRLELVGRMHRSGVRFLAGTDSPSLGCFPGFGVHDELELLVRAGLSPVEALKTATVNPARYLGRQAELGTIEAGKIADLVLLEANPLIDIGNTREIVAVVAAGRLIDEAERQGLLESLQ